MSELLTDKRRYLVVRNRYGETLWYKESFPQPITRELLSQMLASAPEDIKKNFLISNSYEPGINLKESGKNALFYDVREQDLVYFEELMDYMQQYFQKSWKDLVPMSIRQRGRSVRAAIFSLAKLLSK